MIKKVSILALQPKKGWNKRIISDYDYGVKRSNTFISYFSITMFIFMLLIWSKNWDCVCWKFWFLLGLNLGTPKLVSPNQYTNVKHSMYQTLKRFWKDYATFMSAFKLVLWKHTLQYSEILIHKYWNIKSLPLMGLIIR